MGVQERRASRSSRFMKNEFDRKSIINDVTNIQRPD